MTLINSIAGIRGTIGGRVGDNLTPIDIIEFTSSFSSFIKSNSNKDSYNIVIGRDSRKSGKYILNIIENTIVMYGINVINIDLTTTPTLGLSVRRFSANGGIMVTASHNPIEWNALKIMNELGEVINKKMSEDILKIKKNRNFNFAQIENLGGIKLESTQIDQHITDILNLDIIQIDKIKKLNLKVVVDGINSVGGIAIPRLLEKLNVNYIKLNCEPTGIFSHNPEPLPQNMKDLCSAVIKNKADLGLIVDPDVDRLAIVDEKGNPFGEEYTLVTCADFILSKTKGNTVSNLSSSRALSDIANKYKVKHFYSAVGELNVIEKMKLENAIIGGEGNGGVILPKLHYGRDALTGIAIFLSLIAEKKLKISELKNLYPVYYIEKDKIKLTDSELIEKKLLEIKGKFKSNQITTIDGLKIDFKDSWIHLRKSNTEPILRIYAESNSKIKSIELIDKFKNYFVTS
tara:strand:- start:103141 stop:104520 length:1380 start_codon:yes stop_codon:yes gene_type:complete